MAYTIRFETEVSEAHAMQARLELSRLLDESNDFAAQLKPLEFSFAGLKRGSNEPRQYFIIKRVRLMEAKEYCGQHPGPCAINPLIGERKKMRATYLEWDDWVRFHAFINDWLDAMGRPCEVWSNPHDVKGRMWIRKDNKRRVKWDWEEKPGPFGNPILEWNQGTPSQFE